MPPLWPRVHCQLLVASYAKEDYRPFVSFRALFHATLSDFVVISRAVEIIN